MTENEAKEIINIFPMWNLDDQWLDEDEMQELTAMVIVALTEIQQYRSIGTVEKFKQLSEQFKTHTIDETSCQKRQCNKCDKYRKENEEYHKIGTVDECREAVERQRAKKIVIIKAGNEKERGYIGDFVYYKCPNCGKRIGSAFHYPLNEYIMVHKFCDECSQKLDWSD